MSDARWRLLTPSGEARVVISPLFSLPLQRYYHMHLLWCFLFLLACTDVVVAERYERRRCAATYRYSVTFAREEDEFN